MTASHAENHDRDKLGRWYKDLVSGEPGTFPAYAVFLVSHEDRAAHDVFRAFRSSFEARGAGFEHLVIFGQHGVSSALLRLLSQFGLADEDVPTLALFSNPEAAAVHTVALSPGEPTETQTPQCRRMPGRSFSSRWNEQPTAKPPLWIWSRCPPRWIGKRWKCRYWKW